MIQKNTPKATTGPSGLDLFAFSSVEDGIKTKNKSEKNIATVNNGTIDIFHIIGPNGVIHNCPAQVASNIIRKINHNPFKDLAVIKEIINVSKIVTRSEAIKI